eukprot:2712188-Amphidinium_carterae.1
MQLVEHMTVGILGNFCIWRKPGYAASCLANTKTPNKSTTMRCSINLSTSGAFSPNALSAGASHESKGH